MLQPHTLQVALRAALYLSLQPDSKLLPVRQIARATGLRGPYLSKIMSRLIRAGLVRAFRGPGGGLQLNHAPQHITLWAIMQAVEGQAHDQECALGFRPCSEKAPCPLHRRWLPLRQEMQRIMEETTLAMLARDFQEQTPGWRKSSLRMGRRQAHPRHVAAPVRAVL